MARGKEHRVTREAVAGGQGPIVGRRLIRMLEQQLQHLRQAEGHGNRILHYDHVVVAHLIAFFNPLVESLRLVENVFEQPRARRLFKLPAVRRSTLSDAQRVFDPALLPPIVDDLARRVERTPRGAGLDELTRQIVAVDATFFEVAARIVWALPHNQNATRGSVQMCLHFDVFDGVPKGFTLIPGDQYEGTELGRNIRANTLYLLDRAYQSYNRLDAIAAADSDFVVRLRRSAHFCVQDDRPLTAEDRLAGVQHDRVVTPVDRHYRFAVPVRLVEITVAGAAEPIRLLTNRLDLSAALIGQLYRHRWQIELFFRWLKCVVKQQHFLSESPTGITIQLYVALIGTLLIALEIGTRPSKYDYVMLSLVANGLLSYDEARPVMERRRAERARAAAWQRQYNARKKLAR